MIDTTAIPDAPWVIGLDLSLTSTGIAYADGSVARIQPGDRRGPERLDHIRTAVRAALDCWESRPDLAVIEGYSFRSTQGACAAGELGGLIRWEIWRNGIPFAVIAPAKLKVYATGGGGAGKAEMVANARERLGYTRFQDDEVDALWLRALGCDLEGAPLVQLPKRHRRALAGVERVPGRDRSAPTTLW